MKKIIEKKLIKDEFTLRIRSQVGLKKGHLTKEVYQNNKVEGSFEFGDLVSTREAMGWNNVDLSNSGIRTTYQKIASTDYDIPVRIYDVVSKKGLKPCILFFHGGGFFGGSLKTVENPCKLLAQEIKGIVISVDYRLAPEHLFPSGFNDCYRVLEYVDEHAIALGINKDKLGVAGDSAGGNLAAVVSLKDRNEGKHRIKFQGLIYPVVNVGDESNDYYEWSLDEYEIVGKHKNITHRLTTSLKGSHGFIANLYLGENSQQLRYQYVSPIFADDLSHMPTTLLINAEYDFLRVEGEAYLKRLIKAGNIGEAIRYRAVDHAFMDKLGDYPEAEDMMKELAKAFKKAIK